MASSGETPIGGGPPSVEEAKGGGRGDDGRRWRESSPWWIPAIRFNSPANAFWIFMTVTVD